VVASLTGRTSATDATILDGMRLAAEESRVALDIVDDQGDAARVDDLLGQALPAGRPVLVVGDAAAVAARRRDIEAAGIPVFLVGADLYTSRQLFRHAFQVSTPVLWEARVIARYLAVDRGIRAAVPVYGSQADAERRALKQAAREEGFGLLPAVAPDEAGTAGADAVISLADAPVAARVAEAAGAAPERPIVALGVAGLSPEVVGHVAAGDVAVAPYTWAGWAEPIARVHDFRERFRARFGRSPGGLEQEGYDAVLVLTDALEKSSGERGEALLRALESFRDEPYSALPVRLGPDDHTFIDDSQLGLFIADGPVAGEPWVTEPPYWRPLMRTFTSDGERTVILDIDKQVFFPGWKDPRPSPKYRRSRYGITTDP
jgi:ABC-type branched-subunit amino acid transport system substrate-binding protein